jgi:hypothetical protein
LSQALSPRWDCLISFLGIGAVSALDQRVSNDARGGSNPAAFFRELPLQIYCLRMIFSENRCPLFRIMR